MSQPTTNLGLQTEAPTPCEAPLSVSDRAQRVCVVNAAVGVDQCEVVVRTGRHVLGYFATPGCAHRTMSPESRTQVAEMTKVTYRWRAATFR